MYRKISCIDRRKGKGFIYFPNNIKEEIFSLVRRERLEGTSLSSEVSYPLSWSIESLLCMSRLSGYIDRHSPLVGVCSKEVSEIDARRSTWRRITLRIYSMTTIVKGSERWVGQGQGVRGPFRYPTPDTCSIPARRQESVALPAA